MAILVRMFVVIGAYLLACMAASLVLTFGMLQTPSGDGAAWDIPTVALWSVSAVAAAVIAGVAMLPALLVIALAEGFAWRSIVLYGALGGVLALTLGYGIDFAAYLGEPDRLWRHERELVAASGIAGGLVYWLFAGRKAGAWKS